MNKNIAIAAVQMDIVWENYEANFRKVKDFVRNVSSKVQLVVFPEMFLTGYSMKTENALSPNHDYIHALQQLAIKYQLSLCGSLKIVDNQNYFNRFYYFRKDGHVFTYDKRHLFRMANEHNYYTQGNRHIVIEEGDFAIRPFICYDLRFPVWMRNKQNEYDVILVVANWPSVRIEAWKTLLKARAIENQSYVVGVNRTGIDGNNISYNGGTCIIDFKGKVLSEVIDNSEEVLIYTINKEELLSFRNSFPAYLDSDNFQIL